MPLKTILKLPEYADEIFDMLWYTLQAAKMHVREEMLLSEILSYFFGIIALVLMASFLGDI